MSLLTRQDVATQHDSGGAEPLHRRRRGLVTTTALLAAVGVGWALLPSAVRLDQEVTPGLPVEAGLLVPGYGERGTYGLHYRHHEEVTITVPVDNDGPLPLRIDEASLPGEPLPLLVQTGDNLPVEVGPWQDGEVELTFRFDNCRFSHERSAETWATVSVAGFTLGRSFEEDLALAHPIVLHGQVIGDCPDRTLVRGDEVRPRH